MDYTVCLFALMLNTNGNKNNSKSYIQIGLCQTECDMNYVLYIILHFIIRALPCDIKTILFLYLHIFCIDYQQMQKPIKY